MKSVFILLVFGFLIAFSLGLNLACNSNNSGNSNTAGPVSVGAIQAACVATVNKCATVYYGTPQPSWPNPPCPGSCP
jgi:hypothetical protein